MVDKKISIIMGIYNCAETLPEAINSILNQTYKEWELILCDDGSIDNTYQIALDYKNRYSEKIHLIRNKQNIGLAKSLNRCLEIATGDYVARMDGDDLSLPNRFQVQVDFLKQRVEFDLVGSSMISFDEIGVKGVRKVKTVPVKKDLIFNNPFCHATIMARKSVYDTLDGYSEKPYITRCEDVELWYRFFERGFRGYNLEEPLYMVRERLSDFKRRRLQYTFDTMRVCFDGYKRLKFPLGYYVFILKPLLSDLVPRNIMKLYHNLKDERNLKK